MRTISERELAVFISLLASKIVEMKGDLARLEAADEDELSDEQVDEQYELQETVEQYENILGGLREEYEAGLADGINLPAYDDLTKILAG